MKIDPESAFKKLQAAAESAAAAAGEASESAPQPSEVANAAGVATQNAGESVIEQYHETREARERLYGIAMDDGFTGSEVTVDDSMHPREFEYGKQGETIGEEKKIAFHEKRTETRGTWPKEWGPNHQVTTDYEFVGLRGRFFGNLDKENFNVYIGAETESGIKDGWIYQDTGQLLKNELFIGLQGRTFAEGGPAGATLGGEVFLGLRNWFSTEYEWSEGLTTQFKFQVDAGLKTMGTGHLGPLGVGAMGEMRAGVRVRVEGAQFIPIPHGHGLQIFGRGNLDFFFGAMARASAHMGATPMFVGVQMGGEAFAGARVRLQTTAGLAYEGTELLGGYGYGEGWAGYGARINVEAGYDTASGRAGMSGDIGAAAGVGGAVGFGISTPIGDFEKSVLEKAPEKEFHASDSKETQLTHDFETDAEQIKLDAKQIGREIRREIKDKL